jgi:hypothetical protein
MIALAVLAVLLGSFSSEYDLELEHANAGSCRRA